MIDVKTEGLSQVCTVLVMNWIFRSLSHDTRKMYRSTQGGLYCIYKRRQPGDMNYNARNEGNYLSFSDVPDCPNIVVSTLISKSPL